MRFLSRVVWSEGMYLGPQHFQMQSRYFEDMLWFLSASSRSYPWGVLHYSVDSEAARNGQAVISFASGILPDGLIFDIPDCDSIPEPASLRSLLSATENEMTLYLAIRARQDRAQDCEVRGEARARYRSEQRTIRDETLGQDENEVAFASKHFFLASREQLDEATIALPLARVLRDGKGGFAYDPHFIPPCLRIGASESLILLLRRMLEAIETKIDLVRRRRRGDGGLDLGTSALDVGNYWFLHCLCSAAPILRQHVSPGSTHPEEVYRDLARLAGALGTFALDSSVGNIPKYVHENLSMTFGQMDRLIRGYLDVVVPSNTIALEFRRYAPYLFRADVNDERCVRRSRWIFGIRSQLGDAMMLRQVPRLVKVCSGRGVQKLMELALPGLPLLHLPVPPSALSAQADMYYFSISLEGPCWQDILHTKTVGVYIPSEIGDATFDVTVIMESA